MDLLLKRMSNSLVNTYDNEYFKETILFFQKFQWLYNDPVNMILNSNALANLPPDWLETLKNLDTKQLNKFIAKSETQIHWPLELKDFAEKCQRLNALQHLVPIEPTVNLPKNFKKKINLKKQHEICQLAELVHNQCVKTNISTIVDLGAGLGYVCQLLHSLFGYKVLGIDSNPKNVAEAKKRQLQMFPESSDFVKYICLDISDESSREIENAIQQEFKFSKDICIIGLHCCGDLSVNMADIFSNIKVAKLFILIPCCYHKMTLSEKCDATTAKEYFNKFPNSKTLRDLVGNMNVDVGNIFRRTFMRLACQETADRWINMSEEIHHNHSFHVLARAVMELFACQNNYRLKKLVRKGTRKSQCKDFETYLLHFTTRYRLEKTDINKKDSYTIINWTEKIKTEIKLLWQRYLSKQNIIEIYSGLQLLLQRPAESFLLIDRLHFLNEKNYKTDIVVVTNSTLSPRCYGMIAYK